MELITAAYCWQTINKLPRMNRIVRRKTYCGQAVPKLITSLNSKCYWPSGMPIHHKNSYTPRSQRCTGLRGAQSREQVNKVKKLSLY
jgi:hypothetical protein